MQLNLLISPNSLAPATLTGLVCSEINDLLGLFCKKYFESEFSVHYFSVIWGERGPKEEDFLQ